ncbi:unnamed protein product, partial [Symbiodinium pilosum]
VALCVVFGMELQLLLPDVIAWNAAITACKRGCWEGALALLPAMSKRQIQPTVVTFAAAVEAGEGFFLMQTTRGLLKACGQGLRWSQALALLEESQRHVRPDLVLFNATVAAAARGGRWHAALAIYTESQRFFEPDIIMVNTVLAALAQSSRWEECLDMLSTRPKPDSISYNTAMSACLRANRWEFVSELCAQMQRRKLRLLDGTFNALSRVFEQSSSWESCLQCLADASNAGLQLSQLTLSVVVSACQKSEKWHQVLQLLRSMEAAGMDSDDVFRAAGMTSHVDMGDLTQALAWYRERPLRGSRLGACRAGAGWLPGRRFGYLDLHGLQPEEARLAVSCALLDAVMLKPGTLPSWGLIIVTGRGAHSEGESVLRPAVLHLLKELGMTAALDPCNQGRVIIPACELLTFISCAQLSGCSSQKCHVGDCWSL